MIKYIKYFDPPLTSFIYREFKFLLAVLILDSIALDTVYRYSGMRFSLGQQIIELFFRV